MALEDEHVHPQAQGNMGSSRLRAKFEPVHLIHLACAGFISSMKHASSSQHTFDTLQLYSVVLILETLVPV